MILKTINWILNGLIVIYAGVFCYYLLFGGFSFKFIVPIYLEDLEKPSQILFFIILLRLLLHEFEGKGRIYTTVSAWICDIKSFIHNSSVVLAFILFVAFLLRTWGLEFDEINFDGIKLINNAKAYLDWDYTVDLRTDDMHYLGYPYFMSHILEWCYRIYSSHIESIGQITNNEELTLWFRTLARWLNVLFELISIGLVYAICRLLFDKAVGLVSAALMAFSIIHIQVTHVVNADILMTMFGLASIFFAVKLRDSEKLLYYFMGGVFAGLSAGAKYNGVFALIFGVLIFLEIKARKRDFIKDISQNLLRPCLAVLGFASAFMIATPGLILMPAKQINAMMISMAYSSVAHVSPEQLQNRLLTLYNFAPLHWEKLTLFFEPIPIVFVFAAFFYYLARFRFENAYLWIFPIVLFLFGCYSMPWSSTYHFLLILTPMQWIVARSAVDLARNANVGWGRATVYFSYAAICLWIIVITVSDTSLFKLPSAKSVLHKYMSTMPNLDNLKIMKGDDRYKQEAVAIFALGPAVKNTRHPGPWRVHWKDGKQRDLSFFPPPRRVTSEYTNVIFPDNYYPLSYPGLIDMAPGKEYTRIIKLSKNRSWLFYAHNSSAKTGMLKVTAPGFHKTFTLKPYEEVFHEFEPKPNLLYYRLVTKMNLESDQRMVVWLGSGQERGWFYLMMGRWEELLKFEKNSADLGSIARRAVAAGHLGLRGDYASMLKEALALKAPGLSLNNYQELLKVIGGGVNHEIYLEPHPELLPKVRYSFSFREQKGGYKFWGDKEEGASGYLYLPANGVMFGPYLQLMPGWYKAVFTISGVSGDSILFKVTGGSGKTIFKEAVHPVPQGTGEIGIPFQITSGQYGWDTEFLVENKGGNVARIHQIKLETDFESHLAWWLGQIKGALENYGTQD